MRRMIEQAARHKPSAKCLHVPCWRGAEGCSVTHHAACLQGGASCCPAHLAVLRPTLFVKAPLHPLKHPLQHLWAAILDEFMQRLLLLGQDGFQGAGFGPAATARARVQKTVHHILGTCCPGLYHRTGHSHPGTREAKGSQLPLHCLAREHAHLGLQIRTCR